MGDGVGTIGSIVALVIARVALSTNFPPRHIFAVATLCPALMLACLAVIGRIQKHWSAAA